MTKCGFCGLALEDRDDVGYSYPDEHDEVTPYHDPLCWYWAHFGDQKEYNFFATIEGLKWWLGID